MSRISFSTEYQFDIVYIDIKFRCKILNIHLIYCPIQSFSEINFVKKMRILKRHAPEILDRKLSMNSCSTWPYCRLPGSDDIRYKYANNLCNVRHMYCIIYISFFNTRSAIIKVYRDCMSATYHRKERIRKNLMRHFYLE